MDLLALVGGLCYRRFHPACVNLRWLDPDVFQQPGQPLLRCGWDAVPDRIDTYPALAAVSTNDPTASRLCTIITKVQAFINDWVRSGHIISLSPVH